MWPALGDGYDVMIKNERGTTWPAQCQPVPADPGQLNRSNYRARISEPVLFRGDFVELLPEHLHKAGEDL